MDKKTRAGLVNHKRATTQPHSRRSSIAGNQAPVSAAGLGHSDENFGFNEAAEVTGVKFHHGGPALHGLYLALEVKFSTNGAPEGRKWEIWPHEAIVRLGRIKDGQWIHLGAFRPPLSYQIRPAMTLYKSDTSNVSFQRRFTPVEIAAIEEWRDDRDLKVQVNVAGFGKRGLTVTWDNFREYTGNIPRSEWFDMLASARLLDMVHLVVPAQEDARLKDGVMHLRAAIEHHAHGDYSDVAQTCRKAIEAIGQTGFGRKAPKEVAEFLRGQEPKQYSLEERAAIVQVAAMLLVHSGSHAGEEEKKWRRADADLALALTAGLLRVAPSRLADPEPEAKTTPSPAPTPSGGTL
jgi:hypothetical protein